MPKKEHKNTQTKLLGMFGGRFINLFEAPIWNH